MLSPSEDMQAVVTRDFPHGRISEGSQRGVSPHWLVRNTLWIIRKTAAGLGNFKEGPHGMPNTAIGEIRLFAR